MVVAHNRETEQRLKKHYLAAMNVQDLTLNRNSAIIMAVQVCTHFSCDIIMIIILSVLNLNLHLSIASKLLMGNVEWMGDLLCDLWWWYT